MAENKFIRVEEDDPTRCQGVDKSNQCPYKAVEGGTYCLRHGGNKQQEANTAKSLRTYRLTKWKSSVDHHVSQSGLKGLREEIAILRVIMEERLNQCDDASTLLIMSGPISELAMKIEKIVTSCSKLEKSMSMVLDKQALLQFAGEVVGIITEELSSIPDSEETLETISDRIINSLSSEE